MPSPYAILAALGVSLAMILAAYFFGHHTADIAWQAKWNDYQSKIFMAKADAEAKARAAEAKNADLAAQLETIRHDADLTTATADARVRDALARMRARNACTGGHGVPGNQAAKGTSDVAAGGNASMADRIDGYLAACSRGSDELAAYARECYGWVASLRK